MEWESACNRPAEVWGEFSLWLLEFCLDCENVVEFSSSLVKMVLSCQTWNLSNLFRVLVNVQNILSFAEALELSLKFWAGCCLSSSCEPAMGAPALQRWTPKFLQLSWVLQVSLGTVLFYNRFMLGSSAQRMVWLQKIWKEIHIIVWMHGRMLSCSRI